MIKLLDRFFNKKRTEIEDNITDIINIEIKLLKIFNKINEHANLNNEITNILEIEVEFDDCLSNYFNRINENYYTSIYWQDLYSIIVELKKIFTLCILYYNKSLIFKNKSNFHYFFYSEIQIFENIKTFLKDYINDRKFTLELLKNNKFEINSYHQNYYKVIKDAVIESNDKMNMLIFLDIIEKINASNEALHILMNKIFIGTNL